MLQDALAQLQAILPLDRARILEYMQKSDKPLPKYDARIKQIADADAAVRDSIKTEITATLGLCQKALEDAALETAKRLADQTAQRTADNELIRARKALTLAKEMLTAAVRGTLGVWGNPAVIKRFVVKDDAPFTVIDPSAPAEIKAFYHSLKLLLDNFPEWSRLKSKAPAYAAARDVMQSNLRTLRSYALQVNTPEKLQCLILDLIVGEPLSPEKAADAAVPKAADAAPKAPDASAPKSTYLTEAISSMSRVIFAIQTYGEGQ